jgi:hypothetical protein
VLQERHSGRLGGTLAANYYFLRPCFLPPPFAFGVAFFLPVDELFGVSALDFLLTVRLLAM